MDKNRAWNGTQNESLIMITNFEEYTADLTESDQALIDKVVNILETCVDKKSALTNLEIRRILVFKHNISVDGTKIRKIIHKVRVHHKIPCLISTKKGYYIANTEEEMNNYIKSLYQRERSISYIRHALEHQKNTKYGDT